MDGLTEARRLEMLRLNEQRRGEVMYDRSRLRIELGRCEMELIRIEDAIQELQNDKDDVKGTID